MTSITPSGKVVNNFSLDTHGIKLAIKNLGEQKSKYNVSPGRFADYGIRPNELCFSFKSSVGRFDKASNTPTFSVFNGRFLKSQTNVDIVNSIQFSGVSGGSGSYFDEDGKTVINPDLALTMGGLATITNNGDNFISNGDIIIWSLPDQKSFDRAVNGSTRIVAKLEVLKVNEFSFLTDMSLKKIFAANPGQFPIPSELSDAYKLISEAIIELKNITSVKTLGAPENKVLSNLFGAFLQINSFEQKRIVGIAQSPAAPGKEFDILLGRYRI